MRFLSVGFRLILTRCAFPEEQHVTVIIFHVGPGIVFLHRDVVCLVVGVVLALLDEQTHGLMLNALLIRVYARLDEAVLDCLTDCSQVQIYIKILIQESGLGTKKFAFLISAPK